MTRVRPALLIFFALTAASPVAAQRYVKEAGADHFLLLKDDGTVWGFGACWAGQLGPIVENCRYVRSPQQIALPGKPSILPRATLPRTLSSRTARLFLGRGPGCRSREEAA